MVPRCSSVLISPGAKSCCADRSDSVSGSISVGYMTAGATGGDDRVEDADVMLVGLDSASASAIGLATDAADAGDGKRTRTVSYMLLYF